MHTPLEIKSIKIEDNYSLICKMMHDLHVNEYSLFNKTASWTDIEKTYMKHVITMQNECEGLCLVAYKGEVPVGFIFGYLEEQDDSRIEIYTGKELYVSDGYVVENYRRMGIYHRLNKELEDHFVNLGVKRIVRFTLVKNTGMRQFLDSDGYFVSRLLYEKWI